MERLVGVVWYGAHFVMKGCGIGPADIDGVALAEPGKEKK